MVFSSITFLYFFLPAVLLIYYISPKKIKNIVLLLSGLFFLCMGRTGLRCYNDIFIIYRLCGRSDY